MHPSQSVFTFETGWTHLLSLEFPLPQLSLSFWIWVSGSWSGSTLVLGFVDSRPTTDTGQSSNLHLARLVLIPARDRSPKQRHFVNPSIRLPARMRKSVYP
jgi:hypothetical protein